MKHRPKVKVDPKDIIPYSELLKERAVVVPDKKSNWERPPTVYSNVNREELIDKILNDD